MNHTECEQYAALLARNPLFASFNGDELEALVKCGRVASVKAREVAYHKGAPGSQMFAILRGGVKVVSLSDEGKEVIFAILPASEVFGEMSLLDGQGRTATVYALVDSELLVLDRQDFIPFLERNPSAAIKLLVALCKRLRATDEMVEDIVFLDLQSRLAKKLLGLATEHGRPGPAGSTVIACKLSQTELANMVGTSRESVNRQMRLWEDAGLIRTNRGYVVVSDAGALQSLSRNVH